VEFDHCGHYMGYVVAQFLEALRYKPEGRGSDSRWYLWNFSLTQTFRPHSACNTNEYQEYFLGGKAGRYVGMTTLPSSCADCIEIWEPHPSKHSGPVQVCTEIAVPYLTFQPAYTVCPTRYRTQHFFNNSNTNEGIATKFEQEYVRCVRNEKECVCSVRL